MQLSKDQKITKESNSDMWFNIILYLFIAIIVVLILYPLIYIVSSSFSSPQAVRSGQVWLFPVKPGLEGYKAVFQNSAVFRGFSNSLFYTVFGTLISVTLTIMLAYPLSRDTFVGQRFFMAILLFTMLFDAGLIPKYLMVRNLKMLDTIWALLLPSALVAFQVIIARTFFQQTIPNELAESAEIDGSSDFNFIWRVVLPLSKPILAVLVLMYAIMRWNMYFEALIYLKSESLYPLQLVLRDVLILDTNPSMSVEALLKMQGLKDLMKYSLIVVSSVPILAIYPFAQKHFVKGMLIGSVKG